MQRPNIILTGFMGTGKTTVGKLIAAQLGYNFLDTDDIIVTRAGMPVTEIFRIEGEAGFRDREASLARELSAREGLVISTGGRLLLDAANADALGSSGAIFCLTADLNEILARVAADAGPERPLLAGPEPRKKIATLLESRRAGYARFRQVDTSSSPPQAVADAILLEFGKNSDLK